MVTIKGHCGGGGNSSVGPGGSCYGSNSAGKFGDKDIGCTSGCSACVIALVQAP